MNRILGIPHGTIIVLIRIFLGLIFFSAGMSKLYFEHSFPGIIGPVWLEERLTEHGLGMYARFIGGSQIIVGLLLLTQRFATLGALLCFPIILNIFMVTVSMQWQGTPYVNFVLLLLNAWLLAYDYQKFKFILSDRPERFRNVSIKRKNPTADFTWAIAIFFIVASVPISYLHLEVAWAIVALAMLVIIINQLKQRKKGDS